LVSFFYVYILNRVLSVNVLIFYAICPKPHNNWWIFFREPQPSINNAQPK